MQQVTSSDARLAVIIPAHNAAATLARCLAAIQGSSRRPDEILLYDDGSTDDTAGIARHFGVRVLTHAGPPVGPGVGRNASVCASEADIIVFVDADVIVHADAIARLEGALATDAAPSAVFGSYDRNPPVRRVASLYANLRHHFVHQNSDREAVTFWTGLGAIRRQAFAAIGGFNESFAVPSVEDIDLGARLRTAGYRIRIVPEAQGTHCKDWSLRLLWSTDIYRRAIPWSRLLASGGGRSGHLNAAPRELIVAVLAHSVWLSALGALFTPVLGIAAAATAGAYLWLNRRLLRLFWEVGGLRLTAGGAGLHWLYHLYASAIYGLILLGTRAGQALPWATRRQTAP